MRKARMNIYLWIDGCPSFRKKYSINMKIAEIEQIHSLKRSRCSKTVKMKNMIESVKNEAL